LAKYEKRKVIFKFYEENFVQIQEEMTVEISKVISNDLKTFNSLKQNLNIIDNSNGKNINSAIAKYTSTIRNIFEVMTDYFDSKNFLSKEFLFLNYMSTSGNFPMFKYFTNFELSRMKISPSGMIEVKSQKEQMLIIGGFVIIRILLINIIFEFYKNELKAGKQTSAK
jgi:hypothetical protein